MSHGVVLNDSKSDINYHPALDLNNPSHFINLSPPKLRDAILQIPHEWFLWEEITLVQQAYGENGIIPDKDYQLRLSFWEEYNKQFRQVKQMRISKIVSGICSEHFFYNSYCTQLKKILFIITEPQVTKKTLMYGHHLAMSEVIRIVKLPIERDVKTGLLDSKMVMAKLKLFEYLDQRLNGSLIQRIEQKSLNVNVEVEPEALQPGAAELDARLAELSAELQSHNLLPTPRTILPTEAVIKEAGRVVDVEFARIRDDRDNSHRE